MHRPNGPYNDPTIVVPTVVVWIAAICFVAVYGPAWVAIAMCVVVVGGPPAEGASRPSILGLL